MLTPLSISPYNSRFSLDIDLLIYNDTFNYVNMTHHGFYGGTSLQSQELNELQENIQNQLSLTNTLIGNWLEYDNNINIHGERNIHGQLTGGIYEVVPSELDVFIPIDPENIIDGDTNTANNWYLYKDDYGYEQFIRLQDENISHYEYYTRIKRRIVSGRDPNWAMLRDANNTPFDGTGAHRIQLYYPFPNPVTVNPPVNRSLIDTAQYFSRIPFDGGVQDQHKWNSWGNNTIAIFSGDRITANTPAPGPYVSETRPYGPFVRDPVDPEVSSPWHNLVYELAHPIYEWGNRSFLFQFPFGGFRNSFVGTVESGTQTEIQNGEEGPIAGYIRLKENYPVGGSQTSDSECPSRWRGMKEAFSALLRGKLKPIGYPAMSEPSNIVLYLPCFMGYPTYREETCAYWDSLSGTPDQKDTKFYAMLDEYIADLVYIKENGTENKGTLYIGFDSLANSATPGSIDLYKTIPNSEGSLVQFGYKALNPAAWSAANGGYRSDQLELADHYVRTKLEAAGIIVSGEAVPPSISTQIRIEGGSAKYYGSISPPVVRGNSVFKNFTAIEGTMWTSRAYSAPLSDFTDILRWPSNGFEIVQALIDGNSRPGNPFNQPLQVQVQNGSSLITRECNGMNGLNFSPFYYLHTLNAVIDHIKYVDKTIAQDPNRTDIKLDQNNIIVIPTSIFASNLNEPYANDSTGDITRYYVYLGSNAAIEYRPLFDKALFINNALIYTGGLWTPANTSYWDTNLRSTSFTDFVQNIRDKSKLVSPPKDSPVTGEIVLADGFTREQTYPYDSISKGILTGIYEEVPAQTAVETAYAAALSSLTSDCIEIIARFPQQPEQRSQIYALSWISTKGNVADWSEGGTDITPVTDFTHIKPMVAIKGSYGYTPSPPNGGNPDTWLFSGAGWQIPIIRNQLRVLENNNNLANTNIKSIRTIYYDQGWIFGHDPFVPDPALRTNPIDYYNPSVTSNLQTILYPDNEMPKFIADWKYFLNELDDNMTNSDGLLIRNTILIGDNESILNSGNFQLNEPYFNALKSDSRFSENKYGVDSLQKQLADNGINDIQWSPNLCSDANSCGYPFPNGEQYLVWNKAVSSITTAVLNKVLWEPFVERYKDIPGTTPTGTNYDTAVSNFRDGYPDTNGHEVYYDNLFGTSANVHLYGRMVQSLQAWTIDTTSPTHLRRRLSDSDIIFNCWNNPWYAFLVSVQSIRSCKRGLISKGITTGITPWIAPKNWGGDLAGIPGFVNNSYYDEAIRHEALTGVEIFQLFNSSFLGTDPGSVQVRKEQFTIINAILVDINDKLGGYTPTTLDDSRVSYNSTYVMSGAPTKDGTYLWRVTPKVSTDKIFSNGVLVPKTGSEIGVWIPTITSTKPIITVST